MPRKKTLPSSEEPTPLATILDRSPVAAEPEAQAVAAFQRQRDREQSAELPPPDREVVSRPGHPDRPVKAWAETVRDWTTHNGVGIQHVTAKKPVGEHGVQDVVGIRFDRRMTRTPEEKTEMESIGLTFRKDLEAWVKPYTPEAVDETQDLAKRFAHRRRELAEPEYERQ